MSKRQRTSGDLARPFTSTDFADDISPRGSDRARGSASPSARIRTVDSADTSQPASPSRRASAERKLQSRSFDALAVERMSRGSTFANDSRTDRQILNIGPTGPSPRDSPERTSAQESVGTHRLGSAVRTYGRSSETRPLLDPIMFSSAHTSQPSASISGAVQAALNARAPRIRVPETRPSPRTGTDAFVRLARPERLTLRPPSTEPIRDADDCFVAIPSAINDDPCTFPLRSLRCRVWASSNADLRLLVRDDASLALRTSGATATISAANVAHAYVFLQSPRPYVDVRLVALKSDIVAFLDTADPTAHLRLAGEDVASRASTIVRLEFPRTAPLADISRAIAGVTPPNRLVSLENRLPFSPILTAGPESPTARDIVRLSHGLRPTNTSYALRNRPSGVSRSSPIRLDAEVVYCLDDAGAARNEGPAEIGIPVLDENPRLLFRHPPSATHSVAITTNETKRLPAGIYLNDSLIELGLRLLPRPPSVHVFSTFFYTRLCSGPLPKLSVDVFAHTMLLVPINEHLHWYLALVWNPAAMLSPRSAVDVDLFSEGTPDDSPRPSPRKGRDRRAPVDADTQCAIVILDSLGSRSRVGVFERLRRFLAAEAQARFGVDAADATARVAALYGRPPLQTNRTDCGCFVLEYARRLLVPEGATAVAALLARANLASWFDADAVGPTTRAWLSEAIESLSAEHSAAHRHSRASSSSSDIEELSEQQYARLSREH